MTNVKSIAGVHKRSLSFEERKRIADVYASGVTSVAIKERFNVQVPKLKLILAEFNVPFRPQERGYQTWE